MRVAFLSDTHLGYGINNREYPERRNDSFLAAEAAFRVASGEADVILHGGDIFDKPSPSLKVLMRAFRIFSSLPEKGKYRVRVETLDGEEVYERTVKRIPVIAVHGNHDRHTEDAGVCELLERAGFIVYAHKRRVYVEKDGEGICVVGMGWIKPRYAHAYIEQYSGVRCESPSFFLFHQPVKGVHPWVARENPLPPAVFPPGFDYYLGGHLHKIVNKELAGRHFLIPGSTTMTDLSDAEVERPRIFYIIDGREVRAVEIPGARKGYLVEVEGDTDDVIGAVEERIKGHEGLPPIVKVVLRGSDGGSVNEDVVRKVFEGRALVYIFDRRESEVFKRMKEVRSEVSGESFGREFALSVFREKMGEEWEDWMEDLILRAFEGEEALMNFIEGMKVEEGKEKKGGGTILDWVGG